jgi:ribosomal protein S27AE
VILDANHRDIVLCGRGVHFEGLFLSERPQIHRASGTEDNIIVINGRFRRPHVTAQTVAILHAFCDFCFGTLASKTERLRSQPASRELQEQLVTGRIRCPRCGERTVI